MKSIKNLQPIINWLLCLHSQRAVKHLLEVINNPSYSNIHRRKKKHRTIHQNESNVEWIKEHEKERAIERKSARRSIQNTATTIQKNRTSTSIYYEFINKFKCIWSGKEQERARELRAYCNIQSNNKYVNMTTTPAGTLAIIIYSLFEHILLF